MTQNLLKFIKINEKCIFISRKVMKNPYFVKVEKYNYSQPTRLI